MKILFKKLLKQAPLVETIYTSIKDLMNTFVGNKKFKLDVKQSKDMLEQLIEENNNGTNKDNT